MPGLNPMMQYLSMILVPQLLIKINIIREYLITLSHLRKSVNSRVVIFGPMLALEDQQIIQTNMEWFGSRTHRMKKEAGTPCITQIRRSK